MTAVSLSNLHPDFRLGLLLVGAALLIDVGSSGTFEALLVPHDRLGLSFPRYLLLIAASALGSLFIIGAGIWVDRRPPHGMMAAGAGLLSLGLVLQHMASGLAMAVAGMFLAGTGGAFAGSLVFYAVAVKGSRRFRGALLGALGLAFGAGLEDWTSDVGLSGWTSAGGATGLTVWWVAVSLVLASGALLFLLLPRCFSGNYEPGATLKETMTVPGARARLAWVAAVYLVGAMIIASNATNLLFVTRAMSPDVMGVEFGYRSLALVGGLGALAWGIAADFLPVRRLLIVLAILFLSVAGWVGLLGDAAGGVLLLSFIGGGLISLPWVLMAEVLPSRHFAKLALAVTMVGSAGRMLGVLYWSSALAVWGANSFLWIVLAEAVVLAGVAALRPREPETGS